MTFQTSAIRLWHRLSAMFAAFLVLAGVAVGYLAQSSPDWTVLLGHFGGWVTVAIGVTNAIIQWRTAAARARALSQTLPPPAPAIRGYPDNAP